MVVLIIVAVVCFSAGAVASARWLPALAEGPVGTIAFFVVCGLSGAALATVGIHFDGLARELERTGLDSSTLETSIVADRLIGAFFDGGALGALALIAYLIAPKRRVAAPAHAPAAD